MQQIDIPSLDVPEPMVQSWQKTVDLVAEVANIPASLIMRIHQHEIEVFCTSQSQGNPYHPHEMAELGHGLYCETVVATRRELLVPNALKVPEWDHNPDIEQGMISYYGLPLNWPDGAPFGTICMLDRRENCYSHQSRQLLARFQALVESDLESLFQRRKLEQANRLLEQRVQQRTLKLEQMNRQLCREIDHRTSIERTLAFNDQNDALTGLPNRQGLVNYISSQFETGGGQQSAAVSMAVLYLGVRNFRSINDSYGYLVGDRVLLEIATRLKQALAGEHFVARTSGDEFAVVIVADDLTEQAIRLQQHLFQCLMPAIAVDDLNISLLLSCGIARTPQDSDEAAGLIQKASVAMSASRELGQSYCFYGDRALSAVEDRFQLETCLIDALSNGEMKLHYQPLFCPASGRLLGAEALLRWHHPELGSVSPERFIPLAEHNGQIIEIGNFVLRRAIEQAARWQARSNSTFKISVNISPVQFRDNQLVEHIRQLLESYRVVPQRLELEITEGVLLQSGHQAEQRLTELHALGVTIALDDFGTGYSSLSYLQKYAFDTLKIDRSFIANLDTRPRDQGLVKAILEFARTLGLHVVAEGVETDSQHQFLLEEGCESVQGYLYGRPRGAEQFETEFM